MNRWSPRSLTRLNFQIPSRTPPPIPPIPPMQQKLEMLMDEAQDYSPLPTLPSTPTPLHDALVIEVEVEGPLPSDVKVYAVDPETGYKSLIEGVTDVSFYATYGSVNSISLGIIPNKVKVQAVLDRLENKADPE